MVHDTAARQEARGLKKEARGLAGEARALEGIVGAVLLAGEKEAEAARLTDRANGLQEIARLEDLTVREEPLVKQTKKGERIYYRWVASWREAGKCKKVYVGSCRRMDAQAALQKAKKMKAEALGMAALRSPAAQHTPN